MKKTLAALVLLLLVAGTAWLAVARLDPPPVRPASAPAEEFSAERAMEHVEAIARQPRPVGTDAHAAARAYVVSELEELGFRPEVWSGVGKSQSGTQLGSVRNVVARMPGAEPGGATVLLMTHYDSVAGGPGASDDAVGVATLLETLRALRAGPAPAGEVVALFTDAEELGLLGAEAFSHSHPLGDAVDVVLNFEARGTRGPALMFETGPGNRWSIARFADGAPYPAAASYSYEVYRRLPNDTDYTVFKKRGVAGLNFAHIHGAVGYHTEMDSIEHLDPRSLQHHGANALGVVRELADAGPAPSEGGDAVYFNPLGTAFVHFPASWVLPLLVLLALATFVVLGLGLARRRVRVAGLLGGLLTHVVVLVVLGGLTVGLRGLLFPVRYDFRIWGEGSSLAFTLFALTLLALGLGTALHGIGRRFVRGGDLAASGLLLWLLAGAAVSLAAPGASYLFLIPLLFQVAALGALYARKQEPGAEAEDGERIAPGAFALLAVASIVVALLWAPTLSLLAVGLRIGAAVILAVLTGLLLALLAPQVEVATAAQLRWALPVVLVGAGLVLVVTVRAAGGFGPDDPRPSSLFYALDADAGEAVWASFKPQLDPWSSRVLPEDPERRPLPEMLGHERELTVGPAPVLELGASELELAGDPSGPEASEALRLRLVPPADADRLRIFLEPRSAIETVRLQGREAESGSGGGEGDGPLVVQYVAPPAEGVILELEGASKEELLETLEIAVVAQWWRLPTAAQGGPGPRPDDLMPGPWPWDIDTTMVRRSWTALDQLGTSGDAESAPEQETDGAAAMEDAPEGAVE